MLTASDADDEVRCVVREVVAALRQHPAHRLAVLYANASPYARLLHEHLAAAGITVNGAGVRPVAERATSRLLLGLLENTRTGFRRGDVMRTLGEVPLTTFTGARVSVARFERVSREAGVVGGPDWQTKLAAYVDRQKRDAETAEYESTQARARRNAEAGDQLLAFVTGLQHRLDEAALAPTWHALGRVAFDLLDAVLTEDRRRRLPLEEQYALGVVERVLTGLTALDTQGLAPSLLGLEEVLGVELESALPRVGRFGEGVLVAPLSQAVGLDLDEVWVVGLSEDLYPGRLHEDSLLPERVRAASDGQLPSTRTTLDAKHRQLLAAFDTAPRVTASFPRGDLRRSSERLPSRWLLPSLRALSGNPNLAATRWADGVGASQAWLHSSPSFAASVLSTDEPSTHQEWAMRAAFATRALDDDAVAAARELQRARESDEFTRFDGNLTDSEGLTDFATGERLVSPTSLERYAICPHAWFVERMLHVEPVESPEEAIEINALDVGNIVHESFDQLVTEATERGELPGYGQPWSDAQRRRLQEIGAATADRYEAEGRTGHPRLWPVQRLRILATLDGMVDDDNAWRARPRRARRRQRAALRLRRHRAGHRRPARWRHRRLPRLRRQGRRGPRRHPPRHRHQDRQRPHLPRPQGRPGRGRREAPAARLRPRGPGRARPPGHPRACPLLVRPQAQGARRGGAHARGRRHLRGHRRAARRRHRPWRVPPAGAGEPRLPLGPVPLLQPRRPRARRGAPGLGAQAAQPRARRLRGPRRGRRVREDGGPDAAH